MVIGLGSGPMNPSGSYILARTTPPRWRAFVFSTKQCATPAGGMLAGIIVPAVLIWQGWQAAVGTVAVGAIVVILLIQPARRRLDAERPPRRRFSVTSVIEPIKLVLRHRELRAISLMGYIYGGCQLTLASYLVVYMTERLGLTIAAAGGLLERVCVGALNERGIQIENSGDFVGEVVDRHVFSPGQVIDAFLVVPGELLQAFGKVGGVRGRAPLVVDDLDRAALRELVDNPQYDVGPAQAFARPVHEHRPRYGPVSQAGFADSVLGG
jgi:MFS family permease